ncbi:MAG: ribosomal-processing cysteine protease Prp [Lachnospiraceae bacterium]|nr:ribosomal-processing cysteine protease Prp [Lachnospiraceae bacterium]
MITITILKEKSGNIIGLHTLGHAGFAEYGEDIVCAAVSMLVINTINSLDILLRESFECTQDEEKGIINLHFNQIPSDNAKLLMDSMILGLKEVKKQYGKKYILLKFEEV